MTSKLQKMCNIADELDSLGLHALAEEVGTAMTKLALNPEPSPEAKVKQKEYYDNYQSHRTENKTNDLQKTLNYYLSSAGKPTLKHTGVNDQATQSALTFLGIMPGSYKNWDELFNLVHEKGQQMLEGKNKPATESVEPQPIADTVNNSKQTA